MVLYVLRRGLDYSLIFTSNSHFLNSLSTSPTVLSYASPQITFKATSLSQLLFSGIQCYSDNDAPFDRFVRLVLSLTVLASYPLILASRIRPHLARLLIILFGYTFT